MSAEPGVTSDQVVGQLQVIAKEAGVTLNEVANWVSTAGPVTVTWASSVMGTAGAGGGGGGGVGGSTSYPLTVSSNMEGTWSSDWTAPIMLSNFGGVSTPLGFPPLDPRANNLSLSGLFTLMLEKLQQGWVKRTLLTNDGKMCLVGAAMSVQGQAQGVIALLHEVVKEQFPDRSRCSVTCNPRTGVYCQDRIIGFNDHPKTEFKEIELVLEKCIAHGDALD